MRRVKGTLVHATERCHHRYHKPPEKLDGFEVISCFKGKHFQQNHKPKQAQRLFKSKEKDIGRKFNRVSRLRERQGDFKNSAPQPAAPLDLNALTQTAVEWGRGFRAPRSPVRPDHSTLIETALQAETYLVRLHNKTSAHKTSFLVGERTDGKVTFSREPSLGRTHWTVGSSRKGAGSTRDYRGMIERPLCV